MPAPISAAIGLFILCMIPLAWIVVLAIIEKRLRRNSDDTNS